MRRFIDCVDSKHDCMSTYRPLQCRFFRLISLCALAKLCSVGDCHRVTMTSSWFKEDHYASQVEALAGCRKLCRRTRSYCAKGSRRGIKEYRSIYVIQGSLTASQCRAPAGNLPFFLIRGWASQRGSKRGPARQHLRVEILGFVNTNGGHTPAQRQHAG